MPRRQGSIGATARSPGALGAHVLDGRGTSGALTSGLVRSEVPPLTVLLLKLLARLPHLPTALFGGQLPACSLTPACVAKNYLVRALPWWGPVREVGPHTQSGAPYAYGHMSSRWNVSRRVGPHTCRC